MRDKVASALSEKWRYTVVLHLVDLSSRWLLSSRVVSLVVLER